MFRDQIDTALSNPAALFGPAASGPQADVATVPTPTSQPLSTTESVDLGQLFSTVWEARGYLQDDFVNQPVDDNVLAQGALDGLSAYAQDQGVNLDSIQVPSNAPSADSLSQQAGTPAEAAQAFADFWDAWRKVQYGNVQFQGNYQDLMHASLRSMVDALGDAHTAYLDPDQVRQSDISLQGEYEGIGAFVDTTTEYVTIVSPMDGSPAEAAGLKPGDEVIAIDGKDMTGIPGDQVISYILGPEGSQVTLTIRRQGVDPFDVTITRAHISVPSVTSKMLDNNVAYLQLLTFGSNSDKELHDALSSLLAQNPKGLILDLRNNGGGFLNTAVNIASEFIPDGVVLYEQYGDGSRDTHNALGGGIATDIPMVVLVNGGTASASEILAGAIQDSGRGVLVGDITYGKGSVQQPVSLSNGEGELRITIAHWLTPNERLIDGIGLTPDTSVALSDQDLSQGLDPQLDKAVEIINAQ